MFLSTKRVLGCAAMLGTVLIGGAVLNASVDFLDVDAKASTSNTGVVVVTGAVVCTAGETLSVSGTIVQLHQHNSIAGTGSVDGLTCTGSPQTFAIAVSVLTPANGSFKKGPANLVIGASSTDGMGGFDNLTEAVRIHIGN